MNVFSYLFVFIFLSYSQKNEARQFEDATTAASFWKRVTDDAEKFIKDNQHMEHDQLANLLFTHLKYGTCKGRQLYVADYGNGNTGGYETHTYYSYHTINKPGVFWKTNYTSFWLLKKQFHNKNFFIASPDDHPTEEFVDRANDCLNEIPHWLRLQDCKNGLSTLKTCMNQVGFASIGCVRSCTGAFWVGPEDRYYVLKTEKGSIHRKIKNRRDPRCWFDFSIIY